MDTDFFGRYGVEPVANTLSYLRTIKCFFWHYFLILLRNPHPQSSSREYFNEDSLDAFLTANRAIKQRSCGVMSLAEPRTTVLGVQLTFR